MTHLMLLKINEDQEQYCVLQAPENTENKTPILCRTVSILYCKFRIRDVTSRDFTSAFRRSVVTAAAHLLLLLLFCLVLYFVYVCLLSFARIRFVIGPWGVELANK
jgi:hypothetical protein